MKKLSILLFLLSSFTMLSAQTAVTIQGTVTAAGIPQANVTVTIDGVGGITYNNTVTTDASGFYIDSTSVNTTQGGFKASVPHCTSGTVSDSAYFNPMFNILVINLDACPRTGGTCAANFSFTASALGLAYNFTDMSNSGGPGVNITSWSWDFGDGNSSTLQNPSHTYANPGTYNVCLTITDASGCTDTYCVTITTAGASQCDALFTHRIVSGTTVAFINNSASSSPPISYSWDFGDGNTSTAANPTHTYNTPGPFTVCLTISDGGGCTDSTCQQVSLNSGNACTANWSYSTNGLTASFIDLSTGLGPVATSTWQWDFGDGTTGTAQNPTHTYAAAGAYTVCLIYSSTGMGATCSDTSCGTIQVSAAPTGAIITGNVYLTAFRPGDSATVYLITHDTTGGGTLTAIDSTMTSPQGSYSFNNVSAGDYRTKAALLPGHSMYAGTLPTYHDNDTYWSNATVITVTANSIVTADINMVAGMNPGGPGFIGGLVSQGANKRDPGDPIENVSILLFDDLDNAITHTVTDMNGEYNFPNLAYGTYKVHVEILGKTSTDQFITISGASSGINDVDFVVNSQTVDISTSIELPGFASELSIYPNPTKGNINLEIEVEKVTQLEIILLDQVGRKLLSQGQTMGSGANEVSLDISHLPSGIYLLGLRSGKEIVTQKIIKE